VEKVRSAAVVLASLCAVVVPTVPLQAEPPEEAQAHYQAGLAAKTAKDFEKADAELRQALKLHPDYPDAHWVLAWVLIARGDQKAAADEFREVVRLEPDTERGREAKAALGRLAWPASPQGARPTPTPAERPTTKPAASPADGEWQGKGDHWQISFIVANEGRLVRWFRVEEGQAKAGPDGLFKHSSWMAPSPVAIRDGAFAARSGQLLGAFETPTTAEGAYSSRVEEAERIWTAEHVGPAPPNVPPLTPFDLVMVAVEMNDITEVSRMLAADPECVRGQNAESETVLHVAAEIGDAVLVERVLDAPVDWSDRNAAGDTALHVATTRGDREVVEVLLDRGPDVNAPGNGGKTALHVAAELGHWGAAKALLDRQADPELKDDGGRTPLQLAAAGGHADIVELLRERGATE
jgi:hypothetical protein